VLKRIKGDETLAEERYGEDKLWIAGSDEGKTLKFNDIVYSRIIKNSIYTGYYWDYFTPLPSLYKKPKVLMIGLGGGTVAMQLTRIYKKGIKVDTVEINEKIIKLAKKFLGNDAKKFKILLDDGAKYIKRASGYDVVILDAYEADYIPEVFLGEEFVKDAFNALSDDGILAINYALNFKAFINLQSYLYRLERLFKVYEIRPLLSGNIIVIASKRLEKEAIVEQIKKNFKMTKENHGVIEQYEGMKSSKE
jgi:spermidine synthase